MSRFGSSAARRRIFAQISLALSSRTSDPSQMMRSLRSWSKTLLTNAGWAIAYAPFQLSRMNESIRADGPIRPRSLSANTRVSRLEVECFGEDDPSAVNVGSHHPLASLGVTCFQPGDDLAMLVVGDLVVFRADQALDGEVPVADAGALGELVEKEITPGH